MESKKIVVYFFNENQLKIKKKSSTVPLKRLRTLLLLSFEMIDKNIDFTEIYGHLGQEIPTQSL